MKQGAQGSAAEHGKVLQTLPPRSTASNYCAGDQHTRFTFVAVLACTDHTLDSTSWSVVTPDDHLCREVTGRVHASYGDLEWGTYHVYAWLGTCCGHAA